MNSFNTSKQPHYLAELIVLSAIASSLAGSLPRSISVGPVSLLAVTSLIIASLSIAIFCSRLPKISTFFPLSWPYLAFVIYDALGFYWGPINMESLQDFTIWLGGLGLLLTGIQIGSSNRNIVPIIFQIQNVGIVVVAIYLGVNIATGIKDPIGPMVALPVIAYCLAINKRYYLFASILLTVEIAFNAGRGPLVSVFIMFIFWKILTKKKISPIYIVKLVFLVCFLLLMLSFAFTNIKQLNHSMIGGDQSLKVGSLVINTSGRLYWWNEIVGSYINNPIFGTGEDVTNEMKSLGRWRHPHNDYLRILHHLGGTGLLLWIIFCYKVFTNLSIPYFRNQFNRNNNFDNTIITLALLSFIGMSFLMLTDNPIAYSYVYFPVFTFIGIAYGRIAKHQKTSKLNRYLFNILKNSTVGH